MSDPGPRQTTAGPVDAAQVRVWLDDIRVALCVLHLAPDATGHAAECRDRLALVLRIVEQLKDGHQTAYFAAGAAQLAGLELLALATVARPCDDAPWRLGEAMWLLGRAHERAEKLLASNRGRSGRPEASGRNSAAIHAQLKVDGNGSDVAIADAVQRATGIAVGADEVRKVRKRQSDRARRRKSLPT